MMPLPEKHVDPNLSNSYASSGWWKGLRKDEPHNFQVQQIEDEQRSRGQRTFAHENIEPNLHKQCLPRTPASVHQRMRVDDEIRSTWIVATPAHAVAILGFCTNSECNQSCRVDLPVGTTNIGADMDTWECERCHGSFHPEEVLSSPDSKWTLAVTFKEQGKNKSNKRILTNTQPKVCLAPEGAVLSSASITIFQ